MERRRKDEDLRRLDKEADIKRKLEDVEREKRLENMMEQKRLKEERMRGVDEQRRLERLKVNLKNLIMKFLHKMNITYIIIEMRKTILF